MFSSVRNFLNRHRRKFVVSGLVFGGLYLATSYAQRKLREWQEREARKFIDMARKKQHFESTERTCNQTILSLSKVAMESVLKNLDTDEIIRTLQDNPENKVELWNKMKVMIVTRICVMVYTLCMLVVTLRVQLNIIGGYLFCDSVDNTQSQMITSEIQSKYLSLCHHFISSGIQNLIKQIEEKVQVHVEPISLKDKITLKDVEQIFWKVQTALCTDDNDPIKHMATYLMNNNDVPMSDGVFSQIIRETIDVLESDEVTCLTITSVSHAFIKVTDEIANIYVKNGEPTTKRQLESNGTNGKLHNFTDINKIEMYLVKLLPCINDLIVTKSSRNNSLQDILVEKLTLNDKLKLLGANIYEVFSSV